MKIKKQLQKKQRSTPYGRDVDMHSVKSVKPSAGASALKDEQIEDNSDSHDTSKPSTRAGLLRRQKLELRNLKRGAISEYKQQKAKLRCVGATLTKRHWQVELDSNSACSKRVDKQLQARKSLTHDIAKLEREMLERHAQELSEFECVLSTTQC